MQDLTELFDFFDEAGIRVNFSQSMIDDYKANPDSIPPELHSRIEAMIKGETR